MLHAIYLTPVGSLSKLDGMGVWGPAVFSDDLAADLRAEYRMMIGDGLSGPEATDRLLKEWMPSSEKDPAMAAVFWLSSRRSSSITALPFALSSTRITLARSPRLFIALMAAFVAV